MRKLIFVLLFACTQVAVAGDFGQKHLVFTVDLNDRSDDQFHVTVSLKKSLDPENNIFQFAATAPGTYQTMDIGRFVNNFKAYDKKGNELEVEKLSVNQYKLISPEKVRNITYNIQETWDTQLDGPTVYWMCGTSIEDDHVLINGQAVFGYFSEMQGQPFTINLVYPDTWKVGTALNTDGKRNYFADSYDHAVDSPILLGRLTKASSKFNNTTVDIYTYSKTDKIKSKDLMESMTEMLESANAFMNGMPVDRYTFLFHFEDQSWGAWEHSYSSEYIFQEAEYTEEFASSITSTAAHEFFHVVTPLNIHSEIIENFNFVEPVPSQHLWLYEGVTEWASDLMQLRYDLISLQEFLARVREKLQIMEYYNSDLSLVDLALNSYTEEGNKEYGNIYMKGAVIATLLDIRLLELSKGTYGLRELINDLAQDYGPSRAFDEEAFFEEVVTRTYPEVAEFIDRYIKGTEELPIEEYFAKIGIEYIPSQITEQMVASSGWELSLDEDQQVYFRNVSEEMISLGLQENDYLVAYNGTEVTLANIREVYRGFKELPAGSKYSIGVKRGEEKLTLDLEVLSMPLELKYQFAVDQDPEKQGFKLREAWLENMGAEESEEADEE